MVSPVIPPGLRGNEVHGLSHACDWAPTLLEIAGYDKSSEPKPMGSIDGISLLPMLSGSSSNPRTEIPHSVPETNATGVLRQGKYKLIAGFPGDGSKNGCTGGCWSDNKRNFAFNYPICQDYASSKWKFETSVGQPFANRCPLPDPETGVQTCVSPSTNSTVVVSPNQRSKSDPPSARCAAAMNATGCAVTTRTSKSCSICSRSFNVSLSHAGCRLKDPKHYCNNHMHPVFPPGPSPSPPADGMPCNTMPCLFDIDADPLEKHDLAPQHPQIVAQMVTRLEELRATRLVSPFAGGHHDADACAAWEKNGMVVSPWQSDDDAVAN